MTTAAATTERKSPAKTLAIPGTRAFILLPDNAISKKLIQSAHKFCLAHDDWANDQKRPIVDAKYFEDLRDMLGIFDAIEDPPTECEKLCEAVDELHQEYISYDDRENAAEQPSKYFWEAREKVQEALNRFRDEEPAFPALESIKELHNQGTPHEQIARIYRLFDEFGRPKTHLIQRELDQPGSVINPETFIDPRIVDWRKERGLALDKKELSQDSVIPLDSIPAAPAAETPFQLWEQKVGIEQAARMLKRPQPEVEQLFAKYDQTKKDFEAGKIASYVPAEERDTAPQSLPEIAVSEQKAVKREAMTESDNNEGSADAAPPMPGDPRQAARFLLQQGESRADVIEKTKLKASEVSKIEAEVKKAKNENPEAI
jgi:hypothetical protein